MVFKTIIQVKIKKKNTMNIFVQVCYEFDTLKQET